MWRGLAKVEKLFRALTKFEVGCVKSISFWHDAWCHRLPLCKLFPSCYSISSTKRSTVASCWQGCSKRGGQWTLGLDAEFIMQNSVVAARLFP